jgi:cytochrome P450
MDDPTPGALTRPPRGQQGSIRHALATVAGVTEVAALDLRSADFITDPYPIFAQLRHESPRWHEQTGMWLALSHQHANTVLRDRRLGRIWRDREPADYFEPFNLLHRNQMMENEPPDHTRLRALVAKAFARGHIERLRPRIGELAGTLLDRVAGRTEFDLLADYAEPLPVAVIAELLGVPEADRPLLRPWSNAIVKMYEYERTAQRQGQAVAAAREFADYMRGLARARRVEPGDDLISHLAQIEDGGERLSENELVASAILLLNAGHEASVNVFGNGMVALFRNPAELARVRTDPSVVETAVEEMIRYDAPLQLFERTATADLDLDGVLVNRGEKVAALLGAANRDPAVFVDPDRMDVTRDPNPHLGFGAGIHFCLGAPLARLELQMSVPALLARFPRLELAEAPQLRPTFVLRGYQSVRVSVA